MSDSQQQTHPVRLIKMATHQMSDEKQFDIIMMHHSLEHAYDQIVTLKHIEKLLSPNGICLIRIPISSSYAFDYYRAEWVQIDAPRHFYLHSYKSMAILANHAGLFIESHYCDATAFQFTGSEIIRRGHRSDQGYKLFSKHDLRKFQRKTKILNNSNQGDQAVFYLKRAQ